MLKGRALQESSFCGEVLVHITVSQSSPKAASFVIAGGDDTDGAPALFALYGSHDCKCHLLSSFPYMNWSCAQQQQVIAGLSSLLFVELRSRTKLKHTIP